MGMQTMGSHEEDDSKIKQQNNIPRHNPPYNQALEGAQTQLCDELVTTAWSNRAIEPAVSEQGALRQTSLTVSESKKTVDEVWDDIQRSKIGCERGPKERPRPVTLEAFLVERGVVPPGSQQPLSNPPPPQWLPCPYPSPASFIPSYIPPHMGADAAFPDGIGPLPLPPSLIGTLSDTQAPPRKRLHAEDAMERSVERRQKRMIKNRESAARSRARKQNKVSTLEKENEKLRKRREMETLLPSTNVLEPRFQLRRTLSAPF